MFAKRVRSLAIWLPLLFSCASEAFGQTPKAQEAYARGDYNSALSEWLPRAEQGDPEAENGLGRLYTFGLAVKQDYGAAFKWFERAQNHGNIAGTYNLGFLNQNGFGVPKNPAKAIEYYSKAASSKYPKAYSALAGMYYRGEGTDRDTGKALDLLNQGAQLGDPGSQNDLGWLYSRGEVVTIDKRKAFELFQKSAAQGELNAELNLGLAYLNGSATPIDKGEAERHLLKAAQGGLAGAQQVLGVFYLAIDGDDSHRNYDQAITWLNKAAQTGNAIAEFFLGEAYSNGYGVPIDHLTANSWYRKSANQGSIFAQYSLGVAYTKGTGVERNPEQAAFWFLRSADGGWVEAQFNIGIAYRQGIGVERDQSKAAAWLRKAEAQGDANATLELGRMALSGEGVTKSYSDAAHWFELAIQRGNVAAKVDLSRLYLKGLGIQRDPVKAISLLTEAADFGLEYAQSALAELYRNGDSGFAKDPAALLKVYQRYSDRGSTYIDLSLGYLYLTGTGGVERDLDKARQLFQRCAEKGNAYCQDQLAGFYERGQGVPQDYAKAAGLYEQAARQGYALGHLNLSRLYQFGLGVPQDVDRSEVHARTALELQEKSPGTIGPQLAQILVQLATIEGGKGDYTAAEQTLKRALALYQEASDIEAIATVLSLLAEDYGAQGRGEEAEKLLDRVVAMRSGLGQVSDIPMKIGQAFYLERQGHYDKAVSILGEVTSALEKQAKTQVEFAYLAVMLDFYGRNLKAINKNDEAEKVFKHALMLFESQPGLFRSAAARALADYGSLRVQTGQYKEAITLFSRAFDIARELNLQQHPIALMASADFAKAYEKTGNDEAALEIIRTATLEFRKRMERDGLDPLRNQASERKMLRQVFETNVRILAGLSRANVDQRSEESFEVAQLAHAVGVAAAIGQSVVRNNQQGTQLGSLIRARESAQNKLHRFDDKLLSGAEIGEGASFHQELEASESLLAAINKQLRDQFPAALEFISPGTTPLRVVQKKLKKDELLILTLSDESGTNVWVVGSGSTKFYRSNIGSIQLSQLVQNIRQSLSISPTTVADIPEFPIADAFQIYKELLSPAESLLHQAKHIFFVPDGALQSLPLGVLVTSMPSNNEQLNIGDTRAVVAQRGIKTANADMPKIQENTKFANYRSVSWLAKGYSYSILPSVSSLITLRRSQNGASKAKNRFLGIGDPVLSQPAPNSSITDEVFARRGVGDVRKIKLLPSLPESADELRSLARQFGTSSENLYLGKKATERQVRSLRLNDYRVIAFATHGLVAGELTDVGEPALVLTPPDTATNEDDGLLTASEIAGLELDADLVILSACNTAAPDGTVGAEGLSGLAKAFFYAGARALLVSHWSVSSDAAMRLTTGMFKSSQDRTRRDWAQLLQSSMLALMADKNSGYFAHPYFWSAFTVVGDGH